MNKFPFLAGALLCCAGVSPVLAQNAAPILPSQIDRSVMRPGARALGMGGTVLFGQGATAATHNPAAQINNKSFGSGLELLGRTDNVKIDEITDLIDNVETLNDAIDDAAFPQEGFDKMFDLARSKNGQPLRASGTPALGVSLPRLVPGLSVGILAQGEAIADVRANAAGTTGTRTLSAGGGLLGLSSVGIPVAYNVQMPGKDYGTVGVNLKYIRADYLAASFSANETTRQVTGTTFDRARDSSFDLDLGYITPSLIKNQPYEVRGALSVRHLLSPKFSLQSRGNVETAPNVFTPITIDSSFEQKPQFDAGVSFRSSLLKLAAFGEVHNLSKENGGDRTFHIGAEYALTKGVALRAGFDDDEPTVGVGLGFGGLALDAAVCTDPEKRFALGLSYGF